MTRKQKEQLALRIRSILFGYGVKLPLRIDKCVKDIIEAVGNTLDEKND